MSLEFSWIADPIYLGWLAEGLKNTVLLSFFGVFLALAIGVAGAACLHFEIKGLKSTVTTLVELARNTPSLVQLFFLYFMLSEMGIYLIDFGSGKRIPIFSGFACGVLMLGFYNGAIAVEILRSGLQAVPKQTIEGARSLGYSRAQIFWLVELPISIRLTTPLMTNNLVTLIKTSSQASLVAVADLMYSATQIIMENFKSLEVMIVIWAVYITLVSVAVWVMGRIATAIQIPGYKQ